MHPIIKDLLFPDSPEIQYDEEETLLAEIDQAKNKLHCAWNHFENASQEYVEIAVLELLLAENHYGLLNKQYRLLLGLRQNPISLKMQIPRQTFRAFFSGN